MSGRMAQLEVELFGRTLTEQEYREALRCRQCGYDRYIGADGQRPCRYGVCVEQFCRGCGHSNGGWGPVACPCS